MPVKAVAGLGALLRRVIGWPVAAYLGARMVGIGVRGPWIASAPMAPRNDGWGLR